MFEIKISLTHSFTVTHLFLADMWPYYRIQNGFIVIVNSAHNRIKSTALFGATSQDIEQKQ